MREITEIIIHCSDSPNGKDIRASDIHDWHTSPPRNWDGIGYHHVICVDGDIEDGRPHYWVGAHAKGHNTNSIGICLIGRDEFNKSQIYMLECLIHMLKQDYPNAKVIGHNEVSNKTCPNFDVQKWYNETFKQENDK